MTQHDDALVEAVARAIARVQVEIYGNDTHGIFWKREAIAAIAASRAHDAAARAAFEAECG